MRDRDEIRAAVWGGRSVADRMEQVTLTLKNFEWFDPRSEQHLRRIDERLNQNVLVGAAVNLMQDTGNYTYGKTVGDALLALVPRVLWPNRRLVEVGPSSVIIPDSLLVNIQRGSGAGA